MEKKVYELKIDPELRDYIPPLAEGEFELLTESILEEGCTDPIVVWNGVIVDGHNRYRICRGNNIPFAIQEMEFESKEKAMLWMARKQLGRRNLKPFQRCELVFPLEKTISEDVNHHKRTAISRSMKSGLNLDQTIRTGDVLAEMADVSRATWHMAKALIEEGSEELKGSLRNADVSISAAYKKIRNKEPNQSKGAADKKPEDQGPAEIKAGNEDLPPIVAAHLEHSMPFVPVQADESGEDANEMLDETVISDFKDLMKECAEDAKEILNDAGKISADMIQKIRTELTHCYRIILDELEQMEADR